MRDNGDGMKGLASIKIIPVDVGWDGAHKQ